MKCNCYGIHKSDCQAKKPCGCGVNSLCAFECLKKKQDKTMTPEYITRLIERVGAIEEMAGEQLANSNEIDDIVLLGLIKSLAGYVDALKK